MSPPIKLIYQKTTGTRLSALRSDDTHWMSHRPKKRPWPKKPIASHIISVVVMVKASLVTVFVPYHSRLHPPDSEQIVNSLEQSIADAVLRHSMGARIVAHWNFHDSESMHQRERGEKTVHAVEQCDSVHHRTTENFQGAASVVDAITHDGALNDVGHPRRDL